MLPFFSSEGGITMIEAVKKSATQNITFPSLAKPDDILLTTAWSGQPDLPFSMAP